MVWRCVFWLPRKASWGLGSQAQPWADWGSLQRGGVRGDSRAGDPPQELARAPRPA